MKTIAFKFPYSGTVAMRTVAGGAMLVGSLIFIHLSQAEEESASQVLIPSTSAAILQSIDKEGEVLNMLIQAGKLEDVHHHAFVIRDLVAALPSRSTSLPPDKLAQLKANVQFVATLAQRLDVSGDDKDKAGAESNYKKLQGVLRAIHADYPKSVGK